MSRPLSDKSLRVVLRAAANMIERDAESMRESCQGGRPERDWACDDCPAMRPDGRCQGAVEYESRMATVALLRDHIKSLHGKGTSR